MIPSNIEKRHVIDAMRKIDSDGFPSGRGSKKFLLDFEGKRYPPKYVISLADKFANGKELNPSMFNGGQETNGFLKRLGFDIVEVFPPGHDPTTHPDDGGEAERLNTHDPNSSNDVAKSNGVIESRRKDLNGWVATVVLQSDSDSDYSNDDRMEELLAIVDRIATGTSGDGVILFPGGWFCTKKEKPSTIYDWVEKQIKNILEKTKSHIFVCIGIDGSSEAECGNTQIGLSVDRVGINAMGRKFHPAPQERGHVELAEDYSSKEDGKSRIFELNGVKYFMCVCYDTYGIRHLSTLNPDVDVVLNLVHCFYPKGKGPSGDPYFARHGFAGASKQWRCPVFGTAVFFNRDIPESWPTGVYWNRGDISTRNWSYAYNPIKHEDNFKIDIKEGDIKEGLALIRIYDLETMCNG